MSAHRVHGAALALLIGLAGAMACSPRPTPSPVVSPNVALRVASYNIAAGRGDLAAIAATIRGLDADLVGLQEVDVHWGERSAWQDQATALGEQLGMHVRFAPIYVVAARGEGDSARQFGVALLSRHPIVAFTNRPLTRWSTLAPNAPPAPLPGLLDATVRVHGVDVRVLNTHLDYRADPRVRVQQVAELLAVAAQSPLPTLVLGDLNAPPDAPELAPLLARFADGWHGCTRCGATYPADAPARRIDYVLASPTIVFRETWVPSSVASDHRPAMAAIQVPGTATSR